MKIYNLRGFWQAESGSLTSGRLIVIKIGERFVDQCGNRLVAQEYAVCSGITDVMVQAQGCIWTFLPDPGECELIGLPVGALA